MRGLGRGGGGNDRAFWFKSGTSNALILVSIWVYGLLIDTLSLEGLMAYQLTLQVYLMTGG